MFLCGKVPLGKFSVCLHAFLYSIIIFSFAGIEDGEFDEFVQSFEMLLRSEYVKI